MRIYTKGGDAGQTGLFGGARVPKSDPRVSAYGDIDELNAVLGIARTLQPPPEVATILGSVQDQLFTLGSELATPEPEKARVAIPRTQEAWSVALEMAIDAIDAELPELRSFILPGGTPSAAQLHLARTVCRRAERNVVALAQHADVPAEVLRYLNRLSDYLFMAARLCNARAKVADVAWKPHP
ncbi:MAG: cob(I)yrinic acid a,c-diamide adenosyltransferase [Deltaproteobacteria bacterium]|nr:cob(I)yrinic acid a,c-diamide adenosyltransferase [Deltaproteobacteria bacterium]